MMSKDTFLDVNYVNQPSQIDKTLHPNEVPTQPWDVISIGIVGPLPTSSGYNGILVTVNQFSKMARYIPINMEISSRRVAQKLWERVFKDVGLPKKVISDRGPQFVSNFMKELCLQLGIERNPSTAYHPQTDGQTEHVNQELEQYLRLYISHRQDDWAEWLSIAEFAYNNRKHASTGKSPFLINLGRHPNTGNETSGVERKTPSVEEFLEGMRTMRREVEEALRKTNQIMKERFNKKKGNEKEFAAGGLVWIDGSQYNDGRPTKKLSFKRAGPFPVVRKVGEAAYELKIPKMWKNLHPIINESRLKSYIRPTFEQQAERSNNNIISTSGSERVQEVERILDSKWRGDQLLYLIKWRGQSLEESTWEQRHDILKGAKKLCNNFHQSHPDAPRVPTIRIPRNIAKTQS